MNSKIETFDEVPVYSNFLVFVLFGFFAYIAFTLIHWSYHPESESEEDNSETNSENSEQESESEEDNSETNSENSEQESESEDTHKDEYKKQLIKIYHFIVNKEINEFIAEVAGLDVDSEIRQQIIENAIIVKNQWLELPINEI